jgi:hypothetical protein
MAANYQTVRLARGRHYRPDDGVCVMELASMLAGQPLTDRPRTVSRTLADLLRGYNDGLDHERRQQLKRYAATSLGTARGRNVERERRRVVRAWLATEASMHRPWASAERRLALLDRPYIGFQLATRVRVGDDEALHARVLHLFDRLTALGAAPEPFPAGPERDLAAA